MSITHAAITLDIETTGLDKSFGQDEILQLAIIAEDGAVLYNSYFKPARKREWQKAQEIHGIKPDWVKERPLFSEELHEIQHLINSHLLIVAYNAEFDIAFLKNQGVQFAGKAFFCVMKAYARLRSRKLPGDKTYRNYSLENCADYFGYPHHEFHDALADAQATLFCYHALIANSQRGGLLHV